VTTTARSRRANPRPSLAAPALPAVIRRGLTPAVPLTLALGGPAAAAALAAGRPDAAVESLGLTAVAGLAQLLIGGIRRRINGRSSGWDLVQLLVALTLVASLIQLVVPASFSLYIPVVGIAAAMGFRLGIVIGAGAILMYLVPVLAMGGAGDQLARGVAGACVAVLVATGARYYVANLERTTEALRLANARERRRRSQIAGVEDVGRHLAAGPSPSALARVMDVLVERFDYQQVSIYLASSDGRMQLGAQRGYEAPVEVFDGGHGVIGRVMRQQAAELIEDVTADPDYVSANDGVVSEICAPLLVDGEFLGILNVESVDRRLDRTDLRLVVSVAESVGSYVALGRERVRLADEAVRDALTGLHNRRYLDLALERLFATRARRPAASRAPVSAILFDLDHFGAVNKERGVAEGDAVLRTFGKLLADRFREADIVARYGGEEFLVILDGSALSDAERRANGLRMDFSAATKAAGDRVTLSAGVSGIASGDIGRIDQLVARASAALSMAKRAGRDQVVSAG
jgi:diguanylate cyclase (GGDEF)-like protein